MLRRGERLHVGQHALYACGIGRREIVVAFQQRECGRLLFGVEIRLVHFGLRVRVGLIADQYAAVARNVRIDGFQDAVDILLVEFQQIPSRHVEHRRRRTLRHGDAALRASCVQSQRDRSQLDAAAARIPVRRRHRYRRLAPAACGGGDAESAARGGQRPRSGRRHGERRCRSGRAAQHRFFLRTRYFRRLPLLFAAGENRQRQQQAQCAPDYLYVRGLRLLNCHVRSRL